MQGGGFILAGRFLHCGLGVEVWGLGWIGFRGIGFKVLGWGVGDWGVGSGGYG